jgi:alpha-tubulin suppressor-like RCC1 family protein
MEVFMCRGEEIMGYNTEDGLPRLASQNSALKAPLPLVSIATGSHHAVDVMANGMAYTWGVNT